MSDLLEKIIKDMGEWGGKVASKTNKYIQVAINKGDELTRKGKIQIEIEVTKREYNKKLKEFGEYVFLKAEEGVSDFSIDPEFIKYNETLLSYKKIIEKLIVGMKAVDVENANK
tara:strand:- start:466 stop:807 length:342 start_codon:yes stop_codon:yes gene_type:complete